MVVHFAQTLVSLDAAFLGQAAVRGGAGGEQFVALLVGVCEFVLGVGPLDAVQRGHGDEDVTVLDEGSHVAEEEGQQQRGDVLTVDVASAMMTILP